MTGLDIGLFNALGDVYLAALGGRGIYLEDPSGHLLEIITRPYGSSGWEP
jgi:hypothetical protein